MTIQENAPAPVVYATAMRRFGAYIIDVIIFSVVNFTIKSVLGAAFGFSRLTALMQAATAIYFIFFESFAGATPGKMAVGITVGDTKGKRITPLRALCRYLVLNLPAVPLLAYSFTPSLGTLMDQIEKAHGNPAGIRAAMANPDNIKIVIIYGVLAVVAVILNLILIGLPIIFTQEKTGLHDKLTDTRVFRRP